MEPPAAKDICSQGQSRHHVSLHLAAQVSMKASLVFAQALRLFYYQSSCFNAIRWHKPELNMLSTLCNPNSDPRPIVYWTCTMSTWSFREFVLFCLSRIIKRSSAGFNINRFYNATVPCVTFPFLKHLNASQCICFGFNKEEYKEKCVWKLLK